MIVFAHVGGITIIAIYFVNYIIIRYKINSILLFYNKIVNR